MEPFEIFTEASPVPTQLLDYPQTYGTEGADTMYGDASDRLVLLGGGDDLYFGGDGREIILGLEGNDTCLGGGGDDVIGTQAFGVDREPWPDADMGYDLLDGGIGNDTLFGTATTADTLLGGDGDDLLIIGPGNDQKLPGVGLVDGGSGNDVVLAHRSPDGLGSYLFSNVEVLRGDISVLVAQVAQITAFGTIENVPAFTLTGSGGTLDLGSRISTTTGISVDAHALTSGVALTTTAGADILTGSRFADTLAGGRGDDTFRIDHADVVVERANGGVDTVLLQQAGTWTTAAFVENVTWNGKAALAAFGNHQDNVMTGGLSNDVLRGGNGDDTLFGRAGNDELFGGNGDDTVWGGYGADTLTGGADADTFVLSATRTAANVATITDFTVGEDTIALDHRTYAVFTAGPLPAEDVIAAADVTPTTLGPLLIYDTASGALRYDADGGGSKASILIAQLTPGLTLTADDFVVV